MYSKVGSVIVNLVLGVVMWWSLMAVILFAKGSFSYEWKDIFVIGLVSLAWIVICIWYNLGRYIKIRKGILTYGKKAYFLTLFVPLLTCSVIMAVVQFVLLGQMR